MNNKITILGAGESGTGAALLAKAKGFDVFVSDYSTIADHYKQQLLDSAIRFEEGGHTKEEILDSWMIIKSPGIPENVKIIKKAIKKGIKIVDEIEFAYNYTSAKIIAITGTNGKTTTTMLTYHLLKSAGLNVGIAGNIGKSLARQVIDDSYDYYVVEMSSFQLDGTHVFKPYIALLLNITPDHLNRYEYKFDLYIVSKFRIVQNMDSSDHFIYNADDAVVNGHITTVPCSRHSVSIKGRAESHLQDNNLTFNVDRETLKIAQSETALLGKHNAFNMMAAVRVALILHIKEEDIRSGLKTFKNAPHRLEHVDTIKNVDFINDSKATNVDAVGYALESFERPLVWIAGGVDKGNDYNLIMQSVNRKVKALVCLGKDNRLLREAFHDRILNLLETDNMKDAVQSAMKYAEEHDVVLLSPACASFDLFSNYEDRGEKFKEAVALLKAEFENKTIKQ